MAASQYNVKDVLAMSADECKTALTELGLETKVIKKDVLQVMLINYITKSVDPIRESVQTADPLLGRLSLYLASLSLILLAFAKLKNARLLLLLRMNKLILLAFTKKEMLCWRI